MSEENFKIEAVNDVETARLALRWALERLRKASEDLTTVKDERDKAAAEAARLTEESSRKDAAVMRWKETIRLWESSIKDHKTMEDGLRQDLRKEILHEKSDAEREAQRQFDMHLAAYQRELVEKESYIGSLRRAMVDAVKEAKIQSEREVQSLLDHQSRAHEEEKRAFLDRLTTQENELLRRSRQASAAEQKELDAQRAGIMTELSTRRTALEEDYRSRVAEEVIRIEEKAKAELSNDRQALKDKELALEAQAREQAARLGQSYAELEKECRARYGALERSLLEEKDRRLEEERRALQNAFAAKEKDLERRAAAASATVLDKERALWSAHQARVAQSLDDARRQMQAQRVEFEQGIEVKKKELEMQAATHLAEREGALAQAYDERVAEVRAQFAAQLDTERRNADASFSRKEAKLQDEISGRQARWLAEKEHAQEELRRDLAEKSQRESQAIEAKLGARQKALEEDARRKLTQDQETLRARFEHHERELDGRMRAWQLQMEESARQEKIQWLLSAEKDLESRKSEVERLRAESEARVMETAQKIEAARAQKEKVARDDLARREARLEQEIARREEALRAQYEALALREKETLEKRYLELQETLRKKTDQERAVLERDMAGRLEDFTRGLESKHAQKEKDLQSAIDIRLTELSQTEAQLRESWVRKEAQMQKAFAERESKWLSAQNEVWARERALLEQEWSREVGQRRTRFEEQLLEKQKALEAKALEAERRMQEQWVLRENSWDRAKREALDQEVTALRVAFAAKEATLEELGKEKGKALTLRRRELEAEFEARERETSRKLERERDGLKEHHERRLREVEAQKQEAGAWLMQKEQELSDNFQKLEQSLRHELHAARLAQTAEYDEKVRRLAEERLALQKDHEQKLRDLEARYQKNMGQKGASQG